MEITFEKMLQWPDRDASWYFAVDVIDADVRYPVRIMIDGMDVVRCKHEIPGLNEDIVKAFYRQELEALVQAGRLKPDSARTVNVVFCVDGRREQVRDGDVVIDGTCDKLKAIAAGQGKPTP
jgi:hypothetical protein